MLELYITLDVRGYILMEYFQKYSKIFVATLEPWLNRDEEILILHRYFIYNLKAVRSLLDEEFPMFNIVLRF